MDDNKKYAIIVAGGSGVRMGSELPKQFIEINGLPILMHTINCFYSYNALIKLIIVLPQSQQNFWQQLIKLHNFNVQHVVATGGQTRFHSVKNGLEFVTGPGLIAVHDGVRPLVNHQTIERCFLAAQKSGAVVPVCHVSESLRMVTNNGSVAVNRDNYFTVQTPQVFDAQLLQKAYNTNFVNTFTDDASVVEAFGHKISMVDGNVENIKITRKIDLVIASTLLPKLSGWS